MDYKIIKGDGNSNELEQYRLTFENNESPRKIDNLLWLHQKNLANTNSIFYAKDDKAIAAIYTALPVVFQLENKTENALQSIDTITDIKHRGKGLFPKLAKQLYEDAAKENFSFVYGFPNENSAPGFFKKLGWVSFGEAPFIIKPLRLSYFIKKFLNKNKTTDLQEEQNHHYILDEVKSTRSNGDYLLPLKIFDNSYDVLWKKVSSKIPVGINRNAAYMNWRFVDKPETDYSKIAYYKNNELKGVIVFTIKNKHQGRIGYIMEVIYDTASPDIGHILVKYVNKICRQQKADVILAWAFNHSFNYAAYRKAGFYNFPIKFRPQHLFLGVKVLNNIDQPLLENIKNWYISYADSDTV